MTVLERTDPRAGATPAVYETSERERSAVADARHAVAAWLDDHDAGDDLRDDVLLIVSELVTNALRCTFGVVRVDLADIGDGVRVEVFDESPRFPSVVDAGAGDTHGRGLAIVDALTTDWGCRHDVRDGRIGKVVWATHTAHR